MYAVVFLCDYSCTRQRIEECLAGVADTACDSQMQVEVLGAHYQVSLSRAIHSSWQEGWWQCDGCAR